MFVCAYGHIRTCICMWSVSVRCVYSDTHIRVIVYTYTQAYGARWGLESNRSITRSKRQGNKQLFKQTPYKNRESSGGTWWKRRGWILEKFWWKNKGKRSSDGKDMNFGRFWDFLGILGISGR